MAKFKPDHDGGGIEVDGVHYTCTLGPFHDAQYGDGNMVLHFGFEPTTTCNACPHGHPHEVPGAERVAHSVDEAVKAGWLSRD